MDINALKGKNFEGLLSAKEKSNSNFLVRTDTLVIEIYGGYSSVWVYEVYKVASSDTLIYSWRHPKDW